MIYKDSPNRAYVLVALLGAIGGGLFVALATQAIPRMMAAMMRNMFAQMKASGCNPEEM